MSRRTSVHIPRRELPVLADADVVVLGGSFRGIGAALAAARAGHTVVLADPGTCLGHEITSTGRWWLPAEALDAVDDQIRDVLLTRMPISGCNSTAPDASGAGDEIGLWPDGVKRGLEDLLLAAGVRLLYGCHLVSQHRLDGTQVVVIGTKGGRRVLRADLVIPVDVRIGPQSTTAWWHTLELTGAQGELPRHITVPDELRLCGNTVYLYQGYRGTEHVLVEYGKAAADINEHPAVVMRQCGTELLEHLISTHPELSGAWLAALAPQSLPGNPHRPPVPDPAALLAAGAQLFHSPDEPVVTPEPDLREAVEEGPQVRETFSLRPGKPLARQRVPGMSVPVLDRVDVLVVGTGTSGASAAAAAAGEGANTLATDMNPGLGGTGTFGAVDSYWYGQRSGLLDDVRAQTRNLHKQLGQSASRSKWNIDTKAQALHQLVTERGARILTRSFALAALVDDDQVCGAVFCTPAGLGAVLADVVIDATGDADVAALAGAPLQYGAERTHATMWCSLAQFAEPGRSQNNFGGIVDVADAEDYTRAVLAARRRGGTLHDHGIYLAPRETRNILGRVRLSLTDQLIGRRWPDVINVHFSNHDIKGKSESIWTAMGLIPPNLEIEVPLRALLPRGLDGVLVTGKALSATHDGLAAVRMQADQENLGGVAGLLADRCVRDGTTPATVDVVSFQQELVHRGLLPEHVVRRTPGPSWQVPEHAGPKELVQRLVTEVPLHEYSNMGMSSVHRTGIPFVELIMRRDLPVDEELRAALRSPEADVRQVAAQVLTCRGDHVGVDTLVDELTELLADDVLPARTAAVRHVQLPPDQAAMPIPAYLLYTLGLARDPRAIPLWQQVAAKIDAGAEALRDMNTGTFAYVDAVSFGAERLGDPAAVSVLCALHDNPTLRDQYRLSGFDADVLAERTAMLELSLARALARCGACLGYTVLLRYLRDCRAQFARAAHTELTLLLGRDLGDDPAVWETACADLVPQPAPLPPSYDLAAPDGAVLSCAG